MPDTENLNEAADSGLLQPRLVRVLQWLIVSALENSCCLFHWIPRYNCKLSRWSWLLDSKWNTDQWKTVEPEEDSEDSDPNAQDQP